MPTPIPYIESAKTERGYRTINIINLNRIHYRAIVTGIERLLTCLEVERAQLINLTVGDMTVNPGAGKDISNRLHMIEKEASYLNGLLHQIHSNRLPR